MSRSLELKIPFLILIIPGKKYLSSMADECTKLCLSLLEVCVLSSQTVIACHQQLERQDYWGVNCVFEPTWLSSHPKRQINLKLEFIVERLLVLLAKEELRMLGDLSFIQD